MRRKNFENIGNVEINNIALCDTQIGLYMPIEKMSDNIKAKYEECESYFKEAVAEEHPEIKLTDYILYRDIALHMHIENSEVKYTVTIIIWIEDENGNSIHVEFYDPFEIEINAEDNKYMKMLVIDKLMKAFF